MIYTKKLGGGYEGKPSIFDNMTPDDVILAFFPCTRFEAQILLHFRGDSQQQKSHSDIQKLERDLELHRERYWCLRPMVKDSNRRANGDYMTKPTQYWFIGFKPSQNFIFEPLDWVEYRTHQGMKAKDGKSKTVRRSEIHPQYANRFIRQYVLSEEQFNKVQDSTQ